MLISLLFVVILFVPKTFTIKNGLLDNVDILTENLIENLRMDPVLVADLELSQSSKDFIDKTLENYADILKRTEEVTSRKKRSTDDNYVIDFKTIDGINMNHPRDIVLFQQDGNLYAASIESTEGNYRQLLKIRKYQEKSFTLINQTKISNGVRVAACPITSGTVILVAENNTIQDDFHSQTSVFEFRKNEELVVVQKIHAPHASDVAIWEDGRDLFMAVSQYKEASPSGATFRVDFPLYKWRGSYFDIIQNLVGMGSKRITPFNIEGIQFLAIANSEVHEGTEKIYSHILKYDVTTEKYKLFQRILTQACYDIKQFKIQIKDEEQYFLVVANFYEKDESGDINYNTKSIIYKYIDNYFIPFQSFELNGVSEWLALTIEDGTAILVASTLDGLRSFQYDGWLFVESKIHFLDAHPEYARERVTAMHSYKFNNESVLILVDETRGSDIKNMFTFSFTAVNELKKKHDELLSWCMETTKAIENRGENILLGDVRRGDINEDTPHSESQLGPSNLTNLISTLQTYDSILSNIEKEIENLIATEKEHTIDRNITATKVIFNDTSIWNSPHIDILNGNNITDILENTINIDKGLVIDNKVEFESVQIEKPISPKKINGKFQGMINASDPLNITNMLVNGSVIFEEMVAVDDINNVTITSQNLILNNEDQEFEYLDVDSVDIINLETEKINDVNVNDTNRILMEVINNLDHLKVKNLSIGGFINDLHIDTIYKYALRKTGDQNITQTYYFDHLEVDNMDVSLLSGIRVLDEIVPITGGSFYINKDVKFSKTLHVNDLKALKHLDSLAVVDGKLDVLLNDSVDMQYISGTKHFENLELSNPIKLQGKIRGKQFDTMNPVVEIDSDLVVNGNVSIFGNVIVEEMIKSTDIVDSNNRSSMLRVQMHGLKLTDAVIPIPMTFSQHINVKEVFADTINGIDPLTWVVNGAKQTQKITGLKQFHGDVEISGDTVVAKINDIDIDELQTNVLKREGDQVITGKHYVKYVAADKVTSNSVVFGKHPWTEVITTTDEQFIEGNTVFDIDVHAVNTAASNLEVRGLVNNINLTSLLHDAYTRNSPLTLFGHKSFSNLTIDILEVPYLKDHLNAIINKNMTLKEVGMLFNISAKNVDFGDKLNGIDRAKFVLDENEEEIKINADGREFGTISVLGDVVVDSNRINDLDLDDLENTVKVDEPFTFDSVTFDNEVIISNTIHLKGQVEKMDLDNVFRKGEEDGQQIVVDKKLFRHNVAVAGTVHINGFLNGVNASDLCGFGSTSAGHAKTLILEGDAHFFKGPNIHKVNGEAVKKLSERVWFPDVPTIIEGNIQFKNNVSFEDNVTIKGLVNDIDVNNLAVTYLSKSKNQAVPACMNFEDDVIFEDNLEAPNLTVRGKLNGLDMEKFMKNILLQRPQLFEEKVYIQNVWAESTDGDYQVNKFNLENEVMRYDSANMITGPKLFKNLDIGILRTERNISVQDVDVNYWLANSVLTDGTFSISGRKSIGNATFEKGIGLIGTMNGVKFNKDNIMSKSEPQTITGRKLFVPKLAEDIKFKALKVKGLVNGVDIRELVHNQVQKYGDNTIKSPVIFRNNITTKNINFKKPYHGINVTELIRNVTDLGSLNNLTGYYENLVEMSNKIEESFKDQAYFLDYYKQVPCPISSVRIFSGKFNGQEVLMSFNNDNDANMLRFLDWDKNNNLFVDKKGYAIALGPVPTYMNDIKLNGEDYIYMETDHRGDRQGHVAGTLIHFNNITHFNHTKFYTSGTIFVTSFYMEIAGCNCLLFIDYSYSISILCTKFGDEFHLHQTISSEKAHKASVLNIDGHPYIVTVCGGLIENDYSRTIIWKLNTLSLQFEIHQIIHDQSAISLSTITYNGHHYLAIGHGYEQRTFNFGRVTIRRYDQASDKFKFWQNIRQIAPIDVEFAILPTQELVLYIITENISEVFNVYVYEGIFGFNKKISINTISNVLGIETLSINGSHFVALRNIQDITILQAVFKGNRFE